jgi:aarF domain-containing kinase
MKKLLLKRASTATTKQHLWKQHSPFSTASSQGKRFIYPLTTTFPPLRHYDFLTQPSSTVLSSLQRQQRNYSNNENSNNQQQDQQEQGGQKSSSFFRKTLKWTFGFILANAVAAGAIIKYYELDKLVPRDLFQEQEGKESLLTSNAHDYRKFGETYVRFIRSAYTVAWICADYVLSLRGLEGAEKEIKRKEVHARSAERLVEAFLKNGGIYIKAGQTIASMNHILPVEYTSAFARCQDQCKTLPYADIVQVFLDEFNYPPEHFFSEFEQQPLAAASLAQVHRAKLKTGEEVAVKVQFPGIRGRLVDDVWTIAFFVNIVTKVFPDFKFKWLLDEFEETLPKELDFVHEANNNERTANNFKHRNDVATPRIHWNLTSHKVLTMEFIHGYKINDLQGLQKLGFSPVDVSRIMSEVFGEQVFRFGFVHCDPHPGNILVRKRNGTNHPELVLLDHGLYREITDDFRMDYCQLWKAVVTMDEPNIIYYAGRLGAQDAYQLFAMMLTSREWDQSNKGLQKEMTEEEKLRLKRMTFENIGGIVEVLNNVPRQMLLLFKMNDLLRSVQYDLKVPLVYFAIMARIAQQGLNEYALKTAHGANKIITYFRGVYAATKLDIQMSYFTTVLYVLMFMNQKLGWNPVKNNLTMNKMKMLFEK